MTPAAVQNTDSFAALFPDKAAHWHAELNGDATPDQFTRGSTIKAWWNCPEGHPPFEQQIRLRAQDRKCPECFRQWLKTRGVKPRTAKTLAAGFPALIKEWHPELNGGIKPESVTCGSAKQAWWICAEGHEPYQARINNRTRTSPKPSGCPKCGTLRQQENRLQDDLDKGALAKRHPAIARLWHQEFNGETTPESVTAASREKYWWTCPAGHAPFQQSVIHRIRSEYGCPECAVEGRHAKRRIPAPGRSIQELFPELAAEWDVQANGALTPADLTPHSKMAVHWVCSSGHRQFKSPKSRYRVPVGRIIPCQQCKKEHQAAGHTDAAPGLSVQQDEKRNKVRTPRPYRPAEGKFVLDRIPELAAEWNWEANAPLTPADIAHGSNCSVSWVCASGHSFTAAPAKRIGVGGHIIPCQRCLAERVAA